MIQMIIDFIKRLLGGSASGSASNNENPHPNAFTNRVCDIASEIGWSVNVVSDSMIVTHFEMDEDRSQLVYLFSGETKKGLKTISVSSPAVKLASLGDTDKKELFNELLVMNGQSVNYAWAISEFKEGEELLTANVDLLLDTLDTRELGSAIAATADVADELEKRFGLDDF